MVQATTKDDWSTLKKSRYKQGFFNPRCPEKYKGNPTNIVYRSSWELKFMNFCDRNKDILEWSSEEFFIPYISPVDNRPHRYFVDFKIKMKDKNGKVETHLVEIKPEMQTRPPEKKGKVTKKYVRETMTYLVNDAKWSAAVQYCKQNNYKFTILTENELGI